LIVDMFATFYYYMNWQKYKRCKILLGTPLFIDGVNKIKRIFYICLEGLLGQVECLACCGEFNVCLEIIKVEQSMFHDIL
jgi:hypothetical protein